MSGDDYFDQARLRSLVPLMRELGVEEAFGIVLGPPPPKPTPVEALQERAAKGEAVAEDLAKAKREERIETARRGICDKLGWEFESLTPGNLARVDAFLEPEIFE